MFLDVLLLKLYQIELKCCSDITIVNYVINIDQTEAVKTSDILHMTNHSPVVVLSVKHKNGV